MVDLKFGMIRRYVVLAYDIIVILFSYIAAFLLRVGSFKIYYYTDQLILGTIVLGFCALPFLLLSKIHRSMWRYFSIEDVKVINKNCIYINLAFFASMFILTRLDNVPRSIFIIQHALILAGMIGSRFLYRLYAEKNFAKNNNLELKKIPIIISGINTASENFIRAIFKSKDHDYQIVAIIDNNPSKFGTRIYGIPVMGDIKSLENIVNHLNGKNIKPQKLIITEENISYTQLVKYVSEAEKYGLTVAKIPDFMDFRTNFSGERGFNLKPINIEDLLERPQNILQSANLLSLIANKKILVTGGGGTIGGELVRQISNHSPSQIIILENSEFNLYSISKELDNRNIEYKAIICDVRNETRVAKIFEEYKPEIVFHAAALKHVPIAEENVSEAISINFIGSKIVANQATINKAEMFILISTDKAVNPSNVMGATKRLAEKYIASLAASSPSTTFITLRFGNVLGSSGSVIPLFEEQIRNGGPITVTHPNIIRYFMTVKEAVRLVLESAAIAANHPENSGGIFVLNMGEPVRIYDLAIRMIRMAGLRPDVDIEIKFTGLRPGEKLYEELFYRNEKLMPTSHKNIMLSKPNIAKDFDWQEFTDNIISVENTELLKNLINKAIPEYMPNVVISDKIGAKVKNEA